MDTPPEFHTLIMVLDTCSADLEQAMLEEKQLSVRMRGRLQALLDAMDDIKTTLEDTPIDVERERGEGAP